jgi:hypothetical protein
MVARNLEIDFLVPERQFNKILINFYHLPDNSIGDSIYLVNRNEVKKDDTGPFCTNSI